MAKTPDTLPALARFLTGREGARVGDSEKGKGLSSRHSPEARAIFDRVLNARFGGPSSYALAREECGDWYSGPSWAPFNLWQTAECGGGPEKACAEVLCYGPSAEALWGSIAARYPRPDGVALSLPAACAMAQEQWRNIPRLTPREFREHREKMARHAEQLAVELERFYLCRDPDDCEFPGLLDFAELMRQDELDRLDQVIRFVAYGIAQRALERAEQPLISWGEYNDIEAKARALGYRDSDLRTPAREDARYIYTLLQRDHVSHWQGEYEYGGVPPLPDMLRRIAGKFAEDGQNPPIARPNLANAERNFFARAVCKYFWQSFADISPAIVRDIVCMFYPQGIDENEVSQMAARIKKTRPLPPEPESSDPI